MIYDHKEKELYSKMNWIPLKRLINTGWPRTKKLPEAADFMGVFRLV